MDTRVFPVPLTEDAELFTVQSANTTSLGETKDEPRVVTPRMEGASGPWFQVWPFNVLAEECQDGSFHLLETIKLD